LGSFWELLNDFLRTKVSLSTENTKEKRVLRLTFAARALEAFSVRQLDLRVDFLDAEDLAMSFDARDA
jgi:hypothetical protein